MVTQLVFPHEHRVMDPFRWFAMVLMLGMSTVCFVYINQLTMAGRSLNHAMKA